MTSLRFTPITLGCMSLGENLPGLWNEGRMVASKEDGIACVRRAFAAGIRHFDTAQGYGAGLSEEWLGEALATLPRDEIIITTKVSRPVTAAYRHAFCRENIVAVCEQALRRLRTGYLDYFMFHHLDFSDYGGEALATMAELQQAGKIRSYAACPIWPIRQVLATWPKLRPGHWHTHGGPFWHTPNDTDLATARASGGLAPFLYGLLTGRWGAGDVDEVQRRFWKGDWAHPWFVPPGTPHGFYNKAHDVRATLAAIDAMKREFGVDARGFRSVLLRYILQLPGVVSVCVGFSRWEHVTEAAAAGERRLTDGERQRFYRLMQVSG